MRPPRTPPIYLGGQPPHQEKFGRRAETNPGKNVAKIAKIKYNCFEIQIAEYDYLYRGASPPLL